MAIVTKEFLPMRPFITDYNGDTIKGGTYTYTPLQIELELWFIIYIHNIHCKSDNNSNTQLDTNWRSEYTYGMFEGNSFTIGTALVFEKKNFFFNSV